MTPRYIRALVNLIEHNIFKYFHGVLIGVVFSVVTAFVFSLTDQDSMTLGLWSLLISVSICSVIFGLLWLGFWIWTITYEEKKQSYGELILKLNNCFSYVHMINKLYQTGQEIDKEQNESEYNIFREKFQDMFEFTVQQFCDTLVEHFDKRTNSKCMVSVDVFKDHSNNAHLLSVIPLVCLFQSKHDESLPNLPEDHSVISNTGLMHIISDFSNIKNETEELCYLQNNIQRRWKQNVYKSTKCPKGSVLNSELIVPILPMAFNTDNRPDLIGFIHVKANKRFRFNKGYDLAILNGFADGIHDVIIKYEQIKN